MKFNLSFVFLSNVLVTGAVLESESARSNRPFPSSGLPM